MANRTCAETDCQSEAVARGLCKSHWAEQRRANAKPCSVDGCGKQVDSAGLCPMHYRRVRVHGTLADPVRVDNFSRYRVDNETGCWVWTGPDDGKGYGFFSVPYEGEHRSHRAFWVRHRGAIAPDLELDHLCRNPSCVNPDHLEPVTHAENMRRARLDQNGVGTCRSGKHDITGPDPWMTFAGRPDNRWCKECYAATYQRRLLKMRQRRAK